jgi:hypothetical protein
MEEDKLFQYQMLKRLDIMIKLLLELRPESANKITAREQIEKLAQFGLSVSEIGSIMGLPTPAIGAQLAQIKKRGKR